MNLSRPSEALVPTLDGAVLVALAKVVLPVTGRQVHQLTAAGSEAGVRNVLNRLVRQGVIHSVPAGSANLYTVNREHVAWAAVQQLASLWGAVISRIQTELHAWTVPARSAALFGSAARQDGDQDSDIDVLVVHDGGNAHDEQQWQEQLSRLRRNVRLWTGNHCQIYDLPQADLEQLVVRRDPLVAEWLRDAVPLVGIDIRKALRTSDRSAEVPKRTRSIGQP